MVTPLPYFAERALKHPAVLTAGPPAAAVPTDPRRPVLGLSTGEAAGGSAGAGSEAGGVQVAGTGAGADQGAGAGEVIGQAQDLAGNEGSMGANGDLAARANRLRVLRMRFCCQVRLSQVASALPELRQGLLWCQYILVW